MAVTVEGWSEEREWNCQREIALRRVLVDRSLWIVGSGAEEAGDSSSAVDWAPR